MRQDDTPSSTCWATEWQLSLLFCTRGFECRWAPYCNFPSDFDSVLGAIDTCSLADGLFPTERLTFLLTPAGSVFTEGFPGLSARLPTLALSTTTAAWSDCSEELAFFEFKVVAESHKGSPQSIVTNVVGRSSRHSLLGHRPGSPAQRQWIRRLPGATLPVAWDHRQKQLLSSFSASVAHAS